MELVNDDHIEVISGEGVEVSQPQTLDRRKDVFKPLCPLSADPLLAERRFPKRMAEGRLALIQDLLAVGHEEKPGPG